MSTPIGLPFWANATGGIKSWINVLFGGGRFTEIWPWSSELTGSLSGQLNALSRLTIYITLIMAILLILSGAVLQGIVVLAFGMLILGGVVMYYKRSVEIDPRGVKQLAQPDETMHGFSRGLVDPVNNPYGNPMPYEPGIAVRSSTPPMQYYPDDSLSHIYRGTDEWDQNLFFNQIPDPTLIARPVFWPEDPHPDIVSNEAACGDRFCR